MMFNVRFLLKKNTSDGKNDVLQMFPSSQWKWPWKPWSKDLQLLPSGMGSFGPGMAMARRSPPPSLAGPTVISVLRPVRFCALKKCTLWLKPQTSGAKTGTVSLHFRYPKWPEWCVQLSSHVILRCQSRHPRLQWSLRWDVAQYLEPGSCQVSFHRPLPQEVPWDMGFCCTLHHKWW